MKNIAKKILVLLSATALTACSTFFDKDNTPTPKPLVNFQSEAKVNKLWNTSAGAGAGEEYIKLTPSISGDMIYAASRNGTVTALNKHSGKSLWSINTDAPNSSIATADDIVLIGTQDGQILALRQNNGLLSWKARASSEVLAPAATSQGVALIKTIDGHLTALSTSTGHTLWHYQQSQPTLVLRGASAPLILHNAAIAGFDNGILAKLTLHEGSLLWQQGIASPEGVFTIQRMVDIDADPISYGNRVFAATYQGQVASLDLNSGKVFWSHNISSYSGIATDGVRVYVSDAKGQVWAFDAETGVVDWRQNQLEARNLTGPAVIGNYIVVGDAEGYLHWLNKQDGHFVAREEMNSSGILATPIVDNNILYVYAKDGHLAAYAVR